MSEQGVLYSRKDTSELYFRLRRANGVLEEYCYDSCHWDDADELWRYRGVRMVRRWALFT